MIPHSHLLIPWSSSERFAAGWGDGFIDTLTFVGGQCIYLQRPIYHGIKFSKVRSRYSFSWMEDLYHLRPTSIAYSSWLDLSSPGKEDKTVLLLRSLQQGFGRRFTSKAWSYIFRCYTRISITDTTAFIRVRIYGESTLLTSWSGFFNLEITAIIHVRTRLSRRVIYVPVAWQYYRCYRL